MVHLESSTTEPNNICLHEYYNESVKGLFENSLPALMVILLW